MLSDGPVMLQSGFGLLELLSAIGHQFRSATYHTALISLNPAGSIVIHSKFDDSLLVHTVEQLGNILFGTSERLRFPDISLVTIITTTSPDDSSN